MNVVMLLARLLLALIFGVAGATKLADPAGSGKSMRDFGVPSALAGVAGVGLPVAELIFAVALLPGSLAWWGACGILALLVIFIVGLSVTLLGGRKPDCHCFGQLQSSPIGWDLVIRNIVLASIAGFIVSRGPEGAGVSLTGWWHNLSGTESGLLGIAVALAALAAFQAWSTIELLRQNGRLMLRVEALEKRPQAPAKAPEPEPEPGLPVDADAPGFSLKNLDGETVTLSLLNQQRKPLLLFFFEPGCPSCDAAMPEVARWQNDHKERLLIVPISRGDIKANRAKADKAGVRDVLLQSDREVMSAYRVDGTPGAVLIRNGRIASPAALGADSIARLVARNVMPEPVKKGEPVPSIKLKDLDANTFDVAHLTGKRTLMLFWNPGCGFCQRMLENLKTWERNPPPGAPQLLVVSAGSPADIRKQGFQARVLLDPYFAASHVFQSGGTPSAVLIEDGKIASEVGVGADEVLQLAGAVPENA